MADGILLLRKDRGPTSFDLVALVRRLYQTRRVGHAGSLDPFATGLLVVCLGRATAVIRYMEDYDKRYLATLRLGRTTTSQDLTGETTGGRPPDAAELAALLADGGRALRAAIDAQQGTVSQLPPLHSAIKLDGRPLYSYAHRGEEPDRERYEAKRRLVTVHGAQLVGWRLTGIAAEPLEIAVAYHVSKGTYVRTLVHDLGLSLGFGAYCLALERTTVGPYSGGISQAGLEAEIAAGRGAGLLLDPASALGHLPVIELSTEQGRRIAHGQTIPVSRPLPDTAGGQPERVQMTDPRGLLGVGILTRGAGETPILRAERILTARG
ncbi:MAG: tRNA pseudouridine(55) synthase TruB [Bacillota bacterium]|nr:tRNA pseudouridine(55) synthase TruB [Bacillota bacterium]